MGAPSRSMRVNYDTMGVESFYRLTAETYSNPHYLGVSRVLHALLDMFSSRDLLGQIPWHILDLAAGSGEATSAVLSWQALRRPAKRPLKEAPILNITATDPYTGAAYRARTSRPCHAYSFRDLASTEALNELTTDDGVDFDLTIVSFALHLVESKSELWALLTALSRKSRWLVVIAPHKKPEIKHGWGWVRCDPRTGLPVDERFSPSVGGEAGDGLEIVLDRTRLRLYRSVEL